MNTYDANGFLSRYTPSGTTDNFYAYDLQGNAVQRINQSPSVTSTLTYDGFGARQQIN